MALKRQKTKKKSKTRPETENKAKCFIFISTLNSENLRKFLNNSSHTLINRQEDVIIEPVFIEGLTKTFFFLDIKQQVILV